MSERDRHLSTLQDMGFGPNRAARALKATGYKGVEPAMEWLLTKTDDESLDDPLDSDEEHQDELHQKGNEEGGDADGEPRKPLTEEERRERLIQMEELRKKKRAEREEREKQEALEKEKKRIVEGKGMTEIKQQLAEQEIRKMAEMRRREKLEDKAAKAKILAQIEADKIARRAQFNMKTPGQEETKVTSPPPAASAPPPGAAAVSPRKDYSECRLQIRQSNGKALVASFGAKEPLAAVRLYVEINRNDGETGPVRLMTNFPKKVFSEDDYASTLEDLGLVPSAVIMITK